MTALAWEMAASWFYYCILNSPTQDKCVILNLCSLEIWPGCHQNKSACACVCVHVCTCFCERWEESLFLPFPASIVCVLTSWFPPVFKACNFHLFRAYLLLHFFPPTFYSQFQMGYAGHTQIIEIEPFQTLFTLFCVYPCCIHLYLIHNMFIKSLWKRWLVSKPHGIDFTHTAASPHICSLVSMKRQPTLSCSLLAHLHLLNFSSSWVVRWQKCQWVMSADPKKAVGMEAGLWLGGICEWVFLRDFLFVCQLLLLGPCTLCAIFLH